MKSSRMVRGAVALAALSLMAAACGSSSSTSKATTAATTAATAAPANAGGAKADSSKICDADGLVKAVQGGSKAGTFTDEKGPDVSRMIAAFCASHPMRNAH